MVRLALATAAAAGAAGVLWLGNTPPPKGSAKRLAHEFFVQWIQATRTFDSLLSGVTVDAVDRNGAVLRGHVTAAGPLLSGGSLHEGAVMLLIDNLTTMGILTSGCFPGVSAELGVSILAKAREGEHLSFEVRVLKTGRSLAFTSLELRRIPDDGGRGELVASGTHTKFVAAPLFVRVLYSLLLRLPMLTKFLVKRWLANLTKKAKAAMPKSMGDVLKLRKAAQGSEGDFVIELSPATRNGGGVMHGAAIAGYLADAVRTRYADDAKATREHQSLIVTPLTDPVLATEAAVVVKEMSISYISAVPSGTHTISVTPLSSGCCTSIAELQDRKGRILARGRLSVGL